MAGTSGGSSTAATLSAVTSPTALWPPQSIGGEGGGGEGGGGGGCDGGLSKRIVEMEEEQEELTNSLMEMTSHFAKVRFHSLISALFVIHYSILYITGLTQFNTSFFPQTRQFWQFGLIL